MNHIGSEAISGPAEFKIRRSSVVGGRWGCNNAGGETGQARKEGMKNAA